MHGIGGDGGDGERRAANKDGIGSRDESGIAAVERSDDGIGIASAGREGKRENDIGGEDDGTKRERARANGSEKKAFEMGMDHGTSARKGVPSRASAGGNDDAVAESGGDVIAVHRDVQRNEHGVRRAADQTQFVHDLKSGNVGMIGRRFVASAMRYFALQAMPIDQPKVAVEQRVNGLFPVSQMVVCQKPQRAQIER